MKFWSDDFDMDLLKVFPQFVESVQVFASRELWTVGHRTHGRLNHPTVWNTHGAFVWLAKPNLPRDKNGWFNINGYVDDSEEIECTWLELVRDQWAHNYDFLLMPSRSLFRSAGWNVFEEIMYHARGWRESDRIEMTREVALTWAIGQFARLGMFVTDGR